MISHIRLDVPENIGHTQQYVLGLAVQELESRRPDSVIRMFMTGDSSGVCRSVRHWMSRPRDLTMRRRARRVNSDASSRTRPARETIVTPEAVPGVMITLASPGRCLWLSVSPARTRPRAALTHPVPLDDRWFQQTRTPRCDHIVPGQRPHAGAFEGTSTLYGLGMDPLDDTLGLGQTWKREQTRGRCRLIGHQHPRL